MATQRIPNNRGNQAEGFIPAGSSTFIGGQNASIVPSLVPDNCYYAGINTQVSDGILQPRWALVKKELVFPLGGLKNPISNVLVTYSEVFHGGRYQLEIPYNIGPDFYTLYVISGVIFLKNDVTNEVTTIDIQGGGYLNQNTPRLNAEPAGRFLVIHDYPNFPVILEGITARRADPAKYEVPVSVGGAYNQNRLWIYNAGEEFTAGDPTGSLAAPNAPITFKEVEQPAATFFGQIFELPTDRIEPITAMAPLQMIDTSTGIGPLLIGTKNAIYSVQAQLPRDQWEATDRFVSLFVLNAGIAGSKSWVSVGSDIFFVSPDGQVRTANMSRDSQGQWSKIPISTEVKNWIGKPDQNLTQYTVMAYFDNKIFAAVRPFYTPALDTDRNPIFDVAFSGFVVLSTDNIAKLSRAGEPAWDGLWTGVRPMGMSVNNGRFFVTSKDPQYRNEVYEYIPEQTFDRDGEDIRYVKSTIYTREYYQESQWQNKDLHSIDIDLRNVRGDFKLEVGYKPSQGTQYAPWVSWEHCAPWRLCDFPQDDELNGLAAHNFMELNFGSPEVQAVDPVGYTVYEHFRTVQLKITLEGASWQLNGFRIKAVESPQSEQINLPESGNACVKVAQVCNEDWNVGVFKSCLAQVT